jgi:hypothetical protein
MSGIVQNSPLENFEEGECLNDQNQIHIIEPKLKECVAGELENLQLQTAVFGMFKCDTF